MDRTLFIIQHYVVEEAQFQSDLNKVIIEVCVYTLEKGRNTIYEVS